MVKNTLQVLLVLSLAFQLGGCLFEGRDHDHYRHYDHPEHHDDHEHSSVDVNFHG